MRKAPAPATQRHVVAFPTGWVQRVISRPSTHRRTFAAAALATLAAAALAAAAIGCKAVGGKIGHLDGLAVPGPNARILGHLCGGRGRRPGRRHTWRRRGGTGKGGAKWRHRERRRTVGSVAGSIASPSIRCRGRQRLRRGCGWRLGWVRPGGAPSRWVAVKSAARRVALHRPARWQCWWRPGGCCWRCYCGRRWRRYRCGCGNNSAGVVRMGGGACDAGGEATFAEALCKSRRQSR